MGIRFVPRLCWIAILFAPFGAHAAQEPEQTEGPTADSGLVETARRTLVQLDVTVHGPPDVVASLNPEDFELELARRKIVDFTVDRLCAPAPEAPSMDRAGVVAEADSLAPVIRGVNYMFYFDQHHLTFGGRARSLELTRELIDELIQDGSRATIVSAGRTVRTLAALTADRAVLHDAVDRLEEDEEQWNSFPMQENARVDEVQETLAFHMDSAHLSSNRDRMALKDHRTREGMTRAQQDMARAGIRDALDQGARAARTVARGFQRDEWWHTERALRTFAAVLDRLANFDSPKAVVYFADTVRANAGAHYMGLIGEEGSFGVVGSDGDGEMPSAGQAGGASDTTVPSFDRVIEQASAHGVRLYTVQAEGLVARPLANREMSVLTVQYQAPSTLATDRRFLDAESSLVSFAAETGGQSFLRGMTASKIAEMILDDMTCVYVLSFDPQDLPVDRALPVFLRSRRSKVTTRTRAQLVIRSEGARQSARLLAAFAAPENIDTGGRLAGRLIPTGYEDGKYTALVQTVVSGSPQPQVDWELGISVASTGRKRQDVSGRITVRGRDVPVVFESTVHIAPGPWELTAVARDVVSDEILAARFGGEWPDPREDGVTVGPIALLQPMHGAFLRDGATRRQGALGRDSGEPVRSDLPTALVGIVCRDRSQDGDLRVERNLEGEERVFFPPLDLEPGGRSCAVLSDVIPAGTMTAGSFRYELSVRSGEQPLATGAREFVALELD